MTTKYVARLNGKIVGKRTTKDRTYTHAVVAQSDEAYFRDRAYNYVGNDSDRSNFQFYVEIAACEGKFFEPLRSWEKADEIVGQTLFTKVNPGQPVSALSHTAEAVAEAKADTANGWEGYVAQRRAEEIERFEERRANGGFQPRAITWCGRPDLAEKAKASHWRATNCANVWIVPAEVV